MILLGSYICYTTNTLDVVEAFIAETYVQLVATEPICYSTSRSALLERLLANAPTLYCVVPYVVACVDVSGTVLSGPFICNHMVVQSGGGLKDKFFEFF